MSQDQPVKIERHGTFSIATYADGRKLATNESVVAKHLIVDGQRLEFEPGETKEINRS